MSSALNLDRTLDFKDFEDESSPWSRVACIPRDGTTIVDATEYFENRYPTGRIGLVFETARFFCQRLYRD